jgi:hypothetical protein
MTETNSVGETKSAFELFKESEARFRPYSSKETNKEKFDTTMWFISSLYKEANNLIEENAALKAYANKRSNEEIFADKNNEIKELQEQLGNLYHEKAKCLTIEELNKVEQWRQIHAEMNKDVPHNLAFEYVPTYLDDYIDVICSCGKHYIIDR